MHAVPPWLKTFIFRFISDNGFPVLCYLRFTKKAQGGNSRLSLHRLAPAAGSLEQGDSPLLVPVVAYG